MVLIDANGSAVSLDDTNATHHLNLVWNEDETSAHRTLNFTGFANSGDRTLNLSGNLTVESASIVNQDLTSDASVNFADLVLTTDAGKQARLAYNGSIYWDIEVDLDGNLSLTPANANYGFDINGDLDVVTSSTAPSFGVSFHSQKTRIKYEGSFCTQEMYCYRDSAFGNYFIAAGARNTEASPAALVDNDRPLSIEARAYIGATSTFKTIGLMGFYVDGTPIDNSSAPGRFELWLNPSGSLTPLKRLVIDNAGDIDAQAGNFTTTGNLSVTDITASGFCRSETNSAVGALTFPAMIEVASDSSNKIGNSYSAGINVVGYFDAANLNSTICAAELLFQEASGTQSAGSCTYAGTYGGANIDVDAANKGMNIAGLWFSVSNAGTVSVEAKQSYKTYGILIQNYTWAGGTVTSTGSTVKSYGIANTMILDGTVNESGAGSGEIYGNNTTITDSLAGTETFVLYGDYLSVPATSAQLTTVWGYYLASDVPSYFGGEVEIEGDFNHDGSNFGVLGTAPQAQQAHIVDADGTLADITTKFNTLLADLEGYGLLAAA